MNPPVPYWSLPPDALFVALDSSPAGLSAASARARADTRGAGVTEGRARPVLRLLARQFASPLILILLAGALVSLALRGWVDAGIIVAIVLGSTLLGFVQEFRASRAVAALESRLALVCTVVRDGVEQSVPAAAVVPGDVVLLRAGHLVPADARVIDARDFLVTEAALTGESLPVEKRPATLPADAAVAARTNTVFMGTSVRSGTARVLVARTGRDTEYGEIAARLRRARPESAFGLGLRRFGGMLLRTMLVIVLFVLTVNQLLDRPAVGSLLFAVALAVGLSPELLPAIATITMSAGARELARRGVIVRRLEAIEDLGEIDVLCTDKTGTLTEGRMTLEEACGPDGEPSSRLRELACVNAALETGIANPLDAALVEAGALAGVDVARWRKVDEIPYDFQRKRLTIVVEEPGDAGRHLIVTKGAFDEVLAICERVALADGASAPLDDAWRARLRARFAQRGAAGMRVLAVATARVGAQARYGVDDERGLLLEGLLSFVDPPKAQAAAVVAGLRRLGVVTKVISGDNRHVCAHLARAVGLDASRQLSGDEIAAMRDEALWHQVRACDLFVEVDPQQKERIVRALQHGGCAVGYLGDGINDAPALHAADVGISVEGAVDVARESASVVLLERDLDVLRQGIVDGRRCFANTLKYVGITTSANFGNMVSMALATPFLPFLPLLPKQILLNNFLSDLPSMAIASDRVDPERVERAQHWDVATLRRYMLVFGLTSSVFDLLAFALLFAVLHAGERTFQTAWFIVSLLTEIAVVLVLRTRRPSWRSRPGTLLLAATLAACAGTLALPYLGPLTRLFGFEPLAPALLGACLAIVAAYIVATEAVKRWYFRP